MIFLTTELDSLGQAFHITMLQVIGYKASAYFYNDLNQKLNVLSIYLKESYRKKDVICRRSFSFAIYLCNKGFLLCFVILN